MPGVDTMAPRPRVLLLAEAANPEWVSVPLIGWSMAHALREVADVHLVTQVRNREAIKRQGWVEGRDFTAIDTERLAAPAFRLGTLLRGGGSTGWTTYQAIESTLYLYFERLVWKRFGPAIRRGEYDVVHRVTPVTASAPSPIAGRCRRAGVPFLVGPLNGGLPWPKQFQHLRHGEREWLSYLRELYRLLPYSGAIRRHAAAIIAGSRTTEKQLSRVPSHRLFYMPENAIDPSRFAAAPQREYRSPLRAIFVGRLVPCKGLDMLIEAAAPLLRAGEMELEIVGKGPVEPALREAIAQHGVADRVSMPGWVPHQRIHEHLAEADVLTFPSIRDFGGGVVLEAMAAGVVPIVADYGGPPELISEGTGFKVPLGTPDQVVANLGRVLSRVAEAPSLLDPFARRAVEDVHRRFTWPARARHFLEIYRYVCGQRDAPPAFPAGPSVEASEPSAQLA